MGKGLDVGFESGKMLVDFLQHDDDFLKDFVELGRQLIEFKIGSAAPHMHVGCTLVASRKKNTHL